MMEMRCWERGLEGILEQVVGGRCRRFESGDSIENKERHGVGQEFGNVVKDSIHWRLYLRC